MAGLFGSAASSATSNTVGDLKSDVALSDPPTDTITGLSFSPPINGRERLAVSSWDNKVRIYEIAQNGQSQGLHAYEHSQPVFDCDFSPDGTKVASASADKTIKVCDVDRRQDAIIGTHDQPARTCRFINNEIVASGSWDKTIRFWRLAAEVPPKPLFVINCDERVYSMDIKDNLCIAGLANGRVVVIDLNKPEEIYKVVKSPLKWQTRVVRCFKECDGFAIGSIEGRCAIKYIEEKDANSDFSFKCHRDAAVNNVVNAHAVNDISFHPEHGTFSTAGSDGTFHFWDKDAKHRLKGFPNVGGSITATSFNRTGTIFAYAVGYDWSKGYQHNTQNYPIKVMLHPVTNDECKPRPSVSKKK